MGNTKLISFQGEVSLSDLDNPFLKKDIEKLILDSSHGDHISIKIEKEGYLKGNKFKLDSDKKAYVLGILTTSSIRFMDIFVFLTKYLESFQILSFDEFQEDLLYIYDTDDGIIVETRYERKKEIEVSRMAKEFQNG